MKAHLNSFFRWWFLLSKWTLKDWITRSFLYGSLQTKWKSHWLKYKPGKENYKLFIQKMKEKRWWSPIIIFYFFKSTSFLHLQEKKIFFLYQCAQEKIILIPISTITIAVSGFIHLIYLCIGKNMRKFLKQKRKT